MSTAEIKRAETVPGAGAEKPQQIPLRGWLQIAKRGWKEAQADQVPLLAAGLAYYTFLAIFPTIVAAVLIYGFFTDPSTVAAEVKSALSGVPSDVRDLIVNQMTAVASTSTGAGIGAVVAILLALWSASGGVTNLMQAISLAYDETDDRSFVKKRLTALGLLVGAIVFMAVVLGLVAVLPAVLSAFGTSGPLYWLLQVGRWVVTVVIIALALSVLYKVAPDRAAPQLRWVSVGAAVAAVLIIAASAGFSVYASGQFSGDTNPYAKTYGALASIIVVLFWLWITSYAILLGAEINAEAEHQTVVDTTAGPPRPVGERGATAADTIPDPEVDGYVADAAAAPAPKDLPMTESRPPSAGTEPAPSAAPQDRSTGELIRAMSEDLSTLVRDEIRLAQAEVGQKAKKAGLGLGAFGGAGVVAIYGLGVLIAAAVLGLAHVVDSAVSALIVGVALFVVAGVAALFGKKELSQGAPPVPTETIASVKADVAEIKEAVKK